MQNKRVVAPALLCVLLGTLLVQLPLAIADRTSVYESFDPIVDIRRILLDNHVEAPDEEKMYQAMIAGMIESLGDPYTEYIEPEDTDEFNKVLRGTYAGIGAEVNVLDGFLTIVTPMDDSPALRAGVLAGDVVLEIEGTSTYSLPINEAVDLLMGEPGTDVTIKVRHVDGSEEEITITRAQIVTRTLRGLRRAAQDWSYCVNDDLAVSYVRVTQFNEATVDELEDVLDMLQAGGLNGLILDLRDNPGGALPTAVAMADLFLEEGVILSVRPRVGKEIVYQARAGGTLPFFPMVVLVNNQSASASEIVAGALQDNGRAKVLGTRTFGKGSVQEVRSLPYNRGTLKYTTAHYHLPSGRNIQRKPESETWGVDPDAGFVVPMSLDERIEMMRAKRDYEIIRDVDEHVEPCVDEQWISETLHDKQLAGAVRALEDRLAGGDWPVLTEDEAPVVAFNEELKLLAERRAHLLEQLRRNETRTLEVQDLAEDAGREPLLPEGAEVVQGTLTIRDRHGNVVGEYRIQGGDLEMALEMVALEPVEAE